MVGQIVCRRCTDPAVYTVTVEEADILADVNDRDKQEFIVDLPSRVKPVSIKLLGLSGTR
jgi:hypothetical protein